MKHQNVKSLIKWCRNNLQFSIHGAAIGGANLEIQEIYSQLLRCK